MSTSEWQAFLETRVLPFLVRNATPADGPDISVVALPDCVVFDIRGAIDVLEYGELTALLKSRESAM